MEITAILPQAVAPNRNVMFDATTVPGNCSIIHTDNSGLVTLRALRNGQCRARFRIAFSGNMKADISETITGVTLLSLALARNGEEIPESVMTISVGDTGSLYNVSTEVLVDVPTGCCTTISVKNITDDITIDTINANLIVERVA